ncbi:hypothetical protein [uncultured Kordia sp.]|uniref:hypothetical protein n=1 Tax=uncultured Kordia sp. TaxID=507699 RepID=UPI00260D630A|nr:hypothetical protein [uncultured Kordia sp.]
MLLLTKRKYSKVSTALERTFEIILWLYGNQLRELREHLKDLDVNLAVTFPKVKITSTGIAHITNDGERRVTYTSCTIQNHLYRLRDAGIITDYSFHGTKKPVNFFINPSIFQMHDKSLSSSENQLVTDFLTKKVRDKSEDTRTFTKEIIKKVGNVDNHSHEKEVNSFTDKKISKNKKTYKNTIRDESQKFSNQNASKLGAHEIFPKNELSKYLRNQLQYRTVLLQGLTAHHYDDYSYSASQMNRRLDVEARQGSMSREEFRELLLQLFLKMAAPIWKGMNVYYGSWHKAYIQIDDEYLRNPNGSIPRKETLLYMFGFLVYRINRAKRFFKSKKQYCIHYPCIYFNVTRKLPSEGGFAYTLKWLKQYQKYKDLRATKSNKEQQKQVQDADKKQTKKK